MPKLPALDVAKCANYSPHIVILGAGASRAATPLGDANQVKVPVMLDFVEVLGLEDILASARIDWQGRIFEDVYDELYTADPRSEIINEIEERVYTFFSNLVLPTTVTAYDYLLLALREKDLIATFNWDPFLLQAYQRHRAVWRLPRIVFLHGNVAVGICTNCRVKSYADAVCPKCRCPLSQSRLLYPVRKKNYTADPFISSEWVELRNFLKHAYFLTIFGYSAPDADAAAVEMMKGVWDENETRTLAEVEIIDIKNENELYASWKPFITRHHYGIARDIRNSYLCCHPRRTCEALAFATLQLDAWPNNWMPDVSNYHALTAWISPLIAEEDQLEQTGKPLSGKP